MGCFGSKPIPPNAAEVDLSHFELLKVVGKGGFGKVNAITKLDTQELMALKRMEKYAVLQSSSHLKMVWIERKIMSLTNSPFLCNLLYAFESDKELFLVMPFMQGGDLRFHLKERGTMPVSTCLFYSCEMILGLAAMHEKRVVFRDLKPDNMLLDAAGHLRISDFGLACILEERNNWQTTGQAGCLRGDQLVLLADGVKTIRADQVRVGSVLAGEFGPVTVDEAKPSVASLPLSQHFFRITHSDGSFYIVTGDEIAMHLVTVRYGKSVTLVARTSGATKTLAFANVFDVRTGLECEYGARSYRAIEHDADASNDTPDTLVCQTYADCEAAMWAQWESEELHAPDSLPARAPSLGTLLDLPVTTLAEWWQKPGHATAALSAVRSSSSSILSATPASTPKHGHQVVSAPSSNDSVRLLVLQDAHGEISYRPVQAGDVVRVVICVADTVPGTRLSVSNADGSRSQTFLHIEQILKKHRIELNEAGGVVITDLTPSAADADAASLSSLLLELGARSIISCGAHTNARWNSVDLVDGVERVRHDGAVTSFDFAESEVAACNVTVHRVPHLHSAKHLESFEDAVRSVYGLALDTLPLIDSIEREVGQWQFAPFAVNGNGRYRLADGTLTHNTRGYQSPEVITDQWYGCEVDIWSFGVTIYELLHGVRPWKDWTRLQAAGQQVQQANGAAGAAAANGAASPKGDNGEPAPKGGTDEEKNSEKQSNESKDTAVRNMRQIHISSKLDSVTADFLARILCVDKKKRLGCGPGGWEEVKAHPWFKEVDWDRLARKEVQPPITPDLTRANCTADADLADQLLDRKPRDIPADQQQHFRGWKFHTELHPKPESHGSSSSSAAAASSAKAASSTKSSSNGVVVAEKQQSAQEQKTNQ